MSGLILPGNGGLVRPGDLRLNLGYFVRIVERDHPDWPKPAVKWQAEKMMERHPAILRAYDAGLANGRDLRERLEHGVGVWWDELEPLTPQERGFVLSLVRSAVAPKKAALAVVELADVHKAQKAEAAQRLESDLAADWKAKSAMPDSRVTSIKRLPQ